MLQILEDSQRLLPGLPGLGQLAKTLTGVPEPSEGLCFLEAVADFAVQAERALVAGGSLGEVAQMVLGIPQAVPDLSLDPAVDGFRA